MQTRHLTASFEVKSVAESGEFTGYGSVFGEVDSYREVVAKGAFARSLKEHAESDSMPALLWQHDTRKPIGVWTEMREDDHGLFVKGRLILEVEQAREAYALLKEKAIRGLSIGFIPRKWEDDAEEDVRTLTEIDLWETSIVTFPANRAANVAHVRAAIESGSDVDPRMFERAVRDEFGLSARRAKRLMAGGFAAAFGVRDEQPDAENEAVIKGLLSLTDLIKGKHND